MILTGATGRRHELARSLEQKHVFPVAAVEGQLRRTQSSCLWCSQPILLPPRRKPILTRDWDSTSSEIYTYVACERCGSLWLINPPMPEQMGEHYRADYTPYQLPDTDALSALALPLSARLKAHTTRPQPIRILDYGPGSGTWLCCASKTFPHTEMEAVDFDPDASRQRLKWLNQPIRLLSPDQFLARFAGWDVINFSHSLEHIHNPIDVLDHAVQQLSPGGLLIIDCPSVDSLSLKLWGPFWQGLEAPRHLSIPSRRQILRHLQTRGLSLCRQFSYGSAALFSRTLAQGIRHGRQGPLTAVLSRLGRGVCGCEWINRCCGALGLSTAFRIIASKS